MNNILEIPMVSSMDGELLSTVSFSQDSPREWLRFTLDTLKKQYLSSGEYFNLNFHPWLIGSSNRIGILDHI